MSNAVPTLLEKLLAGQQPTQHDLESIRNEEEGPLLDFKSGRITEPGAVTAARKTLREYVSAFANSTGGILVVGIKNRPRTTEPCQSIGSATLPEWAIETLSGVAQFCSMPPKAYELETPQGRLLFVAIDRQPMLVPVNNGSTIEYHFRIGHQTRRIPDYLIADLLLGRRQHPQVHVTCAAEPSGPRGNHEFFVQISFRATVQNVGLVTAREVAVGVIGWTYGDHGRVTDELKPYINPRVISPTEGWEHHCVLSNVRLGNPIAKRPTIYAMESGAFGAVISLPSGHGGGLHRAALYIHAEGSPPDWHQLEWRVADDFFRGGQRVLVQPTRRIGRPEVAFEHGPTRR